MDAGETCITDNFQVSLKLLNIIINDIFHNIVKGKSFVKKCLIYFESVLANFHLSLNNLETT